MLYIYKYFQYLHLEKKYASTFLVILLTIGIYAQTPLSLLEAVNIGLKNNFDIQISRIETQLTANKLNAVKKERLPQIDFVAGQGNSFVNDHSPTSYINGFYNDNSLSLGVDGNWILFDGFKAKINKERYKALRTESEGKEQLIIENTIHAILLTYYNALMGKEMLNVAIQSQQLSDERYKDAHLQHKLGKVSEYDVLRFENALLIDSSNVIIQKKDADASMLTLNKAMGNKKALDYHLTDILRYTARNYDISVMQKKLHSSNQALKNQYLNLELQKLNTEYAKKAALPTINLNSGISQRFNSTNFPEIPRIKSNTFQYYLQFSANYSLFDGGANKRAVEESELQTQIANLQIDQVKTVLSDELSSLVVNYQGQLELTKVNERLISNLKKNIDMEKDRYINGFSSALDYRTVQLEYINAQLTRLESIYALLVNELEILKLTGGLLKEIK